MGEADCGDGSGRKELWSAVEGNRFEASVHATDDGRIGVGHKGTMIEKTPEEWHELHAQATGQAEKTDKEQQSDRMAQVCLDIHKQLGIKWGDDPYHAIKLLKEHKEDCAGCMATSVLGDMITNGDARIERLKTALRTIRNMVAKSLNPDMFAELHKIVEDVLRCRKPMPTPGAERTKTDMVTVSADMVDGLREEKAKLTSELHVAAGMLSTTEGWSDKHPEDALEFIRKAAAEIVAYDSESQAVKVLMAELLAGGSVDGPAFDKVPSWLARALKDGSIKTSEVGALDYLTFVVSTPDGDEIVGPGDFILRSADGMFTTVKAEDKVQEASDE